METADEELISRSLEFMDRTVKANKPFFLWYNSTRMHVWTHLSPKWENKSGFGLFADGMMEMDWEVGEILKKHEFEVPRTIVHAILDQMLEERRADNARHNYPANYGLDDKAFRERMWPIAEAQAKWVLLREELVKSENIEATEEDLSALAEKEAEMYGLPKDNLLKYYSKNESIKNRIISDKLAAHLRSKVKVTEKVVERK